MFGNGCWSAGFGHVGYLSSSGHEDRDHRFCLSGGTAGLANASSCRSWYGRNVPAGPTGTCDYATLWVR